MDRTFLLNSFLLGAGLSMDAFTVSLANGLNEPEMSRRRMCVVAGAYGTFQALMPMAGRGLVRVAAARFRWFQRRIPWIGAALLFVIGGNMIREAFRRPEARPLNGGTLFVQALATSMDALSVGFAIAAYELLPALATSGIIAAVTFCDCLAGLAIGRRFGLLFASHASVSGGCVLIGIGAEMMLRAL
ncbi:MAG: manganese efflux pump [Oscillibacter sp.]|nr:manganese efflux pump [Oscillibacter sp.]